MPGVVVSNIDGVLGKMSVRLMLGGPDVHQTNECIMIVLCLLMYTAQLRNASVFVSEASMTIEVCVMFTEPVA